MHLSLIGMAGSGKSYWSKRLTERGFHRFCCDDLIEEKLAQELVTSEGTPLDLGSWMGLPWGPAYEDREAAYLTCEGEVLQEILHYLTRHRGERQRVVVDTTGSVIYAPEEVLAKLRQLTTMVYLPVPLEFRKSLLQGYRSRPHPLVWRGMFRRNPGESNEHALARCYPKLVSSREQLYQHYADVRIDFYQRRKEDFTASRFLEIVGETNASRDRA